MKFWALLAEYCYNEWILLSEYIWSEEIKWEIEILIKN